MHGGQIDKRDKYKGLKRKCRTEMMKGEERNEIPGLDIKEEEMIWDVIAPKHSIPCSFLSH